jgi:hypothetical protein
MFPAKFRRYACSLGSSEKGSDDGQARQNQARKRGLQGVNEHFESDFNIHTEQAVFQSFPQHYSIGR